MNRKIGVIFMCIALAMTVLTGCGSRSASSTGSSGGDRTINISFWKSPHSNREEEIWNSIIALFNKEFPNIKVEFLVVPWDQVNQKEMAAFSAGTPPDVSFQVEQYLAYAAVNKLVDLKEYISAEKLAGYPKSALDYCTYQGKLMGVPFVALNTVMFYNKDIFAAAGIQKAPTTWDELVRVAQACTKDTNGDGKTDQYGLLLSTKPRPDMWSGVNFIQQAGGDLWNAEMTNIGFNNEAGITGVQFYTDLFSRYKVVPSIDEFSSEEEEQNAFFTGKIAMWPAQIHIVGNIRNANPQLNLGAFLLPRGPAMDESYANWAFANMGMLSVASDSLNKDASWKFIEFATRSEIESQYLSQVGFFSPQMATNDLMYQDDEIMKVAAPGIAIMQTSPASRNFEAMFSNFPVMLEKCIRGVAEPAQAIQELENDLKELNG